MKNYKRDKVTWINNHKSFVLNVCVDFIKVEISVLRIN